MSSFNPAGRPFQLGVWVGRGLKEPQLRDNDGLSKGAPWPPHWAGAPALGSTAP